MDLKERKKSFVGEWGRTKRKGEKTKFIIIPKLRKIKCKNSLK